MSDTITRAWCKSCNRVEICNGSVHRDEWTCLLCETTTTGLEFVEECCQECGRKRKEAGGETCYRCRVASVGFNWHGGGFGYGRHNFHDRTNAEFVAEHVGDVKGNPNIAHIGSMDWKDV